MKTVLYARSSIKSQEHSIDMQKALALEKTKVKGILFDDLYLDEAVSARKTDIHERPELSRMVEDVKKGLISTIYVYKRDRLARNVVQSMELFELFRSKQVKVIFTAENELPIQYSPAGEFFELIIAGFNQREANQIIQRIKETKYTMTKMGKHTQGPIAYGYVIDEDKYYHLHPEQAATIRKLYNAIIETECASFADFVRDMKHHSWFPENWDYDRVLSLIRKPIYKGIRKIEEFGEFVEIENERLLIVDEPTWYKAQEKMNSLKKTRTRNSNRVPMMLDELLYCDKCNSKMFGKEVFDINTRTIYTCKKHNYIRLVPYLLEEAILEECAKFVTLKFQSNFSEFYKITHTDLIKFYERSISESRAAIKTYEQQLFEYTSTWLQQPAPDLQEQLLYLHNKIKVEKLMQEVFPEKLTELKEQYQLMEQLQQSVDLLTEVLAYDANSKETFIRDIVHRIGIDSPSISIQFRDPFQGKEVVVNVAIS